VITRQEKIKLLQDIAKGKRSIEDILPLKLRTWEQDNTDPDLFHCINENLTRRKDEQLPNENTEWRFFDIFIYKCGPPIAESE
jgi:hypothetical protein